MKKNRVYYKFERNICNGEILTKINNSNVIVDISRFLFYLSKTLCFGPRVSLHFTFSEKGEERFPRHKKVLISS